MKIEITVPVDMISGQPNFEHAANQLLAIANMFKSGVAAINMPITNHSPPLYSSTPSDNHQQPQGSMTTTEDDGPANANAPAVDNTGLPWDERIHSKNKAVNADGTWRARRGVHDATVATVTAELRARGAQGMYMPPQPQTTAPTSSIPMPDMPAVLDRNNPANYTQQPPQYTQQPPQQQFQPPQYTPPQSGQQGYQPPQPPQQQFQPAPHAPQMDFGQFMGELTKRMVPGSRIDANYLMGVCARLSQQFNRPINAITDVSADQNMLNAALQMMTADGTWL